MSKKGRGGRTPGAVRLAVCDVTGCSNLVDSATLLRFPPMSRVQDRVRWWHALCGRVNFKLSVNSAVLTSVCPRHFSAPHCAFPIPDQALPERHDPLVPIPTELVREKGSTVRTYSRRPLAPGTASPTRYKAIAPAALPPPAPTPCVSRWTVPKATPAPAVINQLVAPAPPRPQYRLLPAGGATVAPAPAFQVVSAGGGGGGSSGVIQLMSPGGGQVTAAAGSQFQLVTTSAGPTASQAGLRVIQPATGSRMQLVPTSGAQLVLMPNQQAPSQVNTLQSSLPVVVVNSNGQPAPPAAPPPPQRLPLPRLRRQPRPAAPAGEPVRRGRRGAAGRQSAAASLAISDVQSVPAPAAAQDDDVEVIDVAFGLPEGERDPPTKIEVIDLPAEDSDKEPEDSPAGVEEDADAPDSPDAPVDVPVMTAETMAGCSDGADIEAVAEAADVPQARTEGKPVSVVVKQEQETATEASEAPQSRPTVAVIKRERDADTADTGDTTQPRLTVKQEPAERGDSAPSLAAVSGSCTAVSPAAPVLSSSVGTGATAAAPSIIRLKPLSELTAAGSQRAPPPRVPTPPGISLGSGACQPLSEADLMLRSMKARQRQEEPLPAAKRPRIENAAQSPPASPPPPPPAPPSGRPPTVQALPGRTCAVDASASSVSPPAPPPSVSVDRLTAPSTAPSKRSALEVARDRIATSRRQWRKRGWHVRYHRQDQELGSLLDVLLSESLRASWRSIAQLLNATTNHDTLIGLINHFVVIEKLGLIQTDQDDPDPSPPRAASPAPPGQNGHASPRRETEADPNQEPAPESDPEPQLEPQPEPEPEPQPATVDQSAPDVHGFSLPAGLSITPLITTNQSTSGESSAGSSDVTITPVVRQLQLRRQRPRAQGDSPGVHDSAPASSGITWRDRKRGVRLVICFLCGAGGFTTWLAVHQHLQHYHKERGVLFPDTAALNPGSYVVCTLCPEVTPTPSASVRHACSSHAREAGELTTGAARLRCDVCMLVVGHTSDSVMVHSSRCSRMDGNKPSYTCVPCNADLRMLDHVAQHVEDHSGGRLGYLSRCQLCAFSGDFFSCRRHVRAVHNDNCFLLGCALCPRFGTDSWTRIEQHIYRNHRSMAGPTLQQCNTCHLQLAGGAARVNQHSRLHRDNKLTATPPSRPARAPSPPAAGARPLSPPRRRTPGRVPGTDADGRQRRPGPRSRTGSSSALATTATTATMATAAMVVTGDDGATSDDDPPPMAECDVKPTGLWMEPWRWADGCDGTDRPAADPKLSMSVRIPLRRLELTDFM